MSRSAIAVGEQGPQPVIVRDGAVFCAICERRLAACVCVDVTSVKFAAAGLDLAARQQRYLAIRGHRVSTADLAGIEQLRAQSLYVCDEAKELDEAIWFIDPHTWFVGDRLATLQAIRHEIADVVIAATTLAGLLPGDVTVEGCIDEKTEHDRGRG